MSCTIKHVSFRWGQGVSKPLVPACRKFQCSRRDPVGWGQLSSALVWAGEQVTTSLSFDSEEESSSRHYSPASSSMLCFPSLNRVWQLVDAQKELDCISRDSQEATSDDAIFQNCSHRSIKGVGVCIRVFSVLGTTFYTLPPPCQRSGGRWVKPATLDFRPSLGTLKGSWVPLPYLYDFPSVHPNPLVLRGMMMTDNMVIAHPPGRVGGFLPTGVILHNITHTPCCCCFSPLFCQFIFTSDSFILQGQLISI